MSSIIINKTISIKCILIFLMITTIANSDTSTYIREYTPDEAFTRNWNFVDFKIGPSSGNFYYLMSPYKTNNYKS